jgi:hypothetical protein
LRGGFRLQGLGWLYRFLGLRFRVGNLNRLHRIAHGLITSSLYRSAGEEIPLVSTNLQKRGDLRAIAYCRHAPHRCLPPATYSSRELALPTR